MPTEDSRTEHADIGPNILQRSPIEISLVNRKVASQHFAYLYISSAKQSDASWGLCEIGIKNSGSEPIVVTPASKLQIHVPKELLTTADLNDIRLDAGSENIWSCSLVDGGLVFRLKQDRLEIPNAGAKIFLANVLASDKAALHRSVTFEWRGFSGVGDNSRSIAIYREFIAEKDTAADIRCSLAPRSEYLKEECVYFTPRPTTAQYAGIKNRIIIRIANQGPVLEGENAEFVVSFPTQEYGDSRTALCTTGQLTDVKCFPLEQNGWEIKPEIEGQTKQWVLRPPGGPKTVLAERQTVEFEFRDIVTELQEGTAYALVNWRGISAKNPGYNTLPISKLPPYPIVKTMGAVYEGKPLPAGGGVYYDEPYTVSWDCFAADYCELAETKEELPPRHTINRTAVKDNQEFTVTPAVILPGNFIRRGEAATLKVPMRDAIMDVQQQAQPGVLSKAQLTWSSRGGKVLLTGPIKRIDEKLAAAGTMAVGVSGLYQFQCAGPKSKSAQVIVDLPHVNMTYDAQWSSDKSQLTLSWNAQHATWIEVWAFYLDGREVKDHPQSSGSFTLDANGLDRCSVRASGMGECMWVWYAPRPTAKIPKITAVETKLPAGPNHKITWNVVDAQGCGLLGFGENKEDYIFGFGLHGEIEHDSKNFYRAYMFFAVSPTFEMLIMALSPTPLMGQQVAIKERAAELEAMATEYMKDMRGSAD